MLRHLPLEPGGLERLRHVLARVPPCEVWGWARTDQIREWVNDDGATMACGTINARHEKERGIRYVRRGVMRASVRGSCVKSGMRYHGALRAQNQSMSMKVGRGGGGDNGWEVVGKEEEEYCDWGGGRGRDEREG